jgi:hypothetical protein
MCVDHVIVEDEMANRALADRTRARVSRGFANPPLVRREVLAIVDAEKGNGQA